MDGIPLVEVVLRAIYFFLPAYFANMAPTFVQWIPFKKPLDFGLEWRGKRILGDNKTIRGFIAGILLGCLVYYFQTRLYNLFVPHALSIVDYSQHTMLLGFLLSFGALFGDSVKSFFKRRMDIKPGKPWIPFDQLDFVVGALIFASIIFVPLWEIILVLVVISPLLQLSAHYFGYLVRINRDRI